FLSELCAGLKDTGQLRFSSSPPISERFCGGGSQPSLRLCQGSGLSPGCVCLLQPGSEWLARVRSIPLHLPQARSLHPHRNMSELLPAVAMPIIFTIYQESIKSRWPSLHHRQPQASHFQSALLSIEWTIHLINAEVEKDTLNQASELFNPFNSKQNTL